MGSLSGEEGSPPLDLSMSIDEEITDISKSLEKSREILNSLQTKNLKDNKKNKRKVF